MMGNEDGEKGWLSWMTLFRIFQKAQRSKAEWVKSCRAVAWKKAWSGRVSCSGRAGKEPNRLMDSLSCVHKLKAEKFWIRDGRVHASRVCKAGGSLCQAWDSCLFVKGRGFPSRASKIALLKILAMRKEDGLQYWLYMWRKRVTEGSSFNNKDTAV